jgi:hypothetical protein
MLYAPNGTFSPLISTVDDVGLAESEPAAKTDEVKLTQNSIARIALTILFFMLILHPCFFDYTNIYIEPYLDWKYKEKFCGLVCAASRRRRKISIVLQFVHHCKNGKPYDRMIKTVNCERGASDG